MFSQKIEAQGPLLSIVCLISIPVFVNHKENVLEAMFVWTESQHHRHIKHQEYLSLSPSLQSGQTRGFLVTFIAQNVLCIHRFYHHFPVIKEE